MLGRILTAIRNFFSKTMIIAVLVTLAVGLTAGVFGSRLYWPVVKEIEVFDAPRCAKETKTAVDKVVKKWQLYTAKYCAAGTTTGTAPAEKAPGTAPPVTINLNAPIQITDAAIAALCAGRTPSAAPSAPPASASPAGATPGCPACPACPTTSAPATCVTCSCCPGAASAPASPPSASAATPSAPVTKTFEVAASRDQWLDTGIPAAKIVKIEAVGKVYLGGEVIGPEGKSSDKPLFYSGAQLGELIGGDNNSKWIRPLAETGWSKYEGNLYFMINNFSKRGESCGHFTVTVTYIP